LRGGGKECVITKEKATQRRKRRAVPSIKGKGTGGEKKV